MIVTEVLTLGQMWDTLEDEPYGNAWRGLVYRKHSVPVSYF